MGFICLLIRGDSIIKGSEANADVQAPKGVGVAFAKAKDVTTLFGRSGTNC